ncbi:DUF4352 domain-containing protein [Paenibacillus faecalis]|uniref:DUF4352 domain-containing protein n=1 Tax=Paenibacillus faecalis TaxID=2079532 RepID=UPI000D0F4F34|nr:DUF4352 domain-containing protein [Paenibacillus faecalis]
MREITIGDTFNNGNFAYTILDAKREGDIVTVKAQAKNIAKKAETLYNGSMKLRDSESNTYGHRSDGLSVSKINPGIETQGEITFEVPEDANGLKAAVNTDGIQNAIDNALGNDVSYVIIDIGL